MQAAGRLPDMLLDVAKAEGGVGFVMNRTRQIKAVGRVPGSQGRATTGRGVCLNQALQLARLQVFFAVGLCWILQLDCIVVRA